MDEGELRARIAPLVERGHYVVAEDGRYELVHSDRHGPFLFKAVGHAYQCFLWHHVLFEQFGFVPAACHDCFKTAVYPETLAQLFALYRFQQDGEILAKCGAELRDYVPSLYSGYFYHRGREAAEREHARIREGLARAFGEGARASAGGGSPAGAHATGGSSAATRVVLKRACTEFALGMDDDLSASASANAGLEAAVTALFETHDHALADLEQPDEDEVLETQRLWVTWALRHDDPTVGECEEAAGLFDDFVVVDAPAADPDFVTILPI